MIASSPRTRWSPPVPRWAKVAEAIREQIRAGHLAAGARLPSTAALATRYGVSATPVQKALTVRDPGFPGRGPQGGSMI